MQCQPTGIGRRVTSFVRGASLATRVRFVLASLLRRYVRMYPKYETSQYGRAMQIVCTQILQEQSILAQPNQGSHGPVRRQRSATQ